MSIIRYQLPELSTGPSFEQPLRTAGDGPFHPPKAALRRLESCPRSLPGRRERRCLGRGPGHARGEKPNGLSVSAEISAAASPSRRASKPAKSPPPTRMACSPSPSQRPRKCSREKSPSRKKLIGQAGRREPIFFLARSAFLLGATAPASYLRSPTYGHQN